MSSTRTIAQARTLLASSVDETLATADTLFASEDSPANAPSDAVSTATAPRRTAPPAAFATGAERYETGALIGEGGMGRVLAARDKQFGRTVALKELTAAPSMEAIRRFLQESVVTANLEHPGVVAVYERGVRAGSPFYTMRRVEGRTLSEALREASTLRKRLELLPAVVRVAHTLGFAHERGVVHRDVKPDNVVLGAHGETVLLDWGIARVLEARDEGAKPGPAESASLPGGKTVAGSVLGTPAYMAPEQASGSTDAVDARTDVFAIGAMLYEVLTGRAPYEGETVAQLVAKALEARPTPLSELAAEAPEALRAIVQRAMAREKSERYGSAAEVASALEAFQSDALTERESAGARAFTTAVSFGMLLLIAVLALILTSTVSSLREQGFASFFYMLFTLLGVSLSVLEWRTRGRYMVRGVAAAIAGATALFGIANTAGGLSIVHKGLVSAGSSLSAERFLVMHSEGSYEVLGNVATSLALAAVQWIVLAVASRAVDRANAAHPRRT